MTIYWGAYELNSGTGMRAGLQIESQSNVVHASTTFVVTFTCWVQPGPNQSGYEGSAFNDSQTYDLSVSAGSLNDSSIAWQNTSNNLTPQQAGPQTITLTYTYGGSSYGVSPGGIQISGTVNGVFNGITPNSGVFVDIPARPWANAAATTSATATRVSDTQASVAWTNNNSTPAAYSNIKLYRRDDAGGWSLRVTLGVVASYSDTSVVANHKYRFRPNVLGGNGVEITGAETNDIWTTPGAPTNLVATKLGNNSIRLDWTNNVNYSEYTVRIEESQNGGAFTELTSVSNGVITYEHVAPSTSVTHTYRIRARSNTGTLNSAYSANSNTVTLLATANPPIDLVPSGTARDATEEIVFTWQHNPADGTPQSKYQLQYKVGAGSYTTVGPTTSTVSSFALAATTLANGNTITWRVATAGENLTIGAYSAESTFTTSDRPTSTVSSPGANHSLSSLTVTWSYFQTQSSAQAAWHLYLWKKGLNADYSDATLIEEASGSGATASYALSSTLLDAATYGIRVYVTSAAGLESITSGSPRQEFLVTYLPPANTTITVAYTSDYGRMVITIQSIGAVEGVTEPVSTVDLQRQIDGGDWVTWASGIVLQPSTLAATVIDTAPTIRGTNNYRAVARSAVPSSALSPEVSVNTAEPLWGFLSTGPAFSQVVRMRAHLANRVALGRAKNTYHFAGRENPVELSGEEVSLKLAMTAILFPSSQGGQSSEPEELEDLAHTTGVVLWRDYRGRRIYASLSDVNIDYVTLANKFPVAFNLSRVDYDEDVG